jgi:hypothetical protein
MKNLKRFLAIVFLFSTSVLTNVGQTTYNYPLTDDFSGLQTGAPDLIQIPNNSGQTGEFVVRPVPVSTCGTGGDAGGYFFEDDAGLQFNNPSGFIDQEYSLAFNFQVDEFLTPPPWVRILSFTHTDDVGVYIKLTNPPTNGTLEFWPYGTVGETDFFTTVDFYQLILVRQASGMIRIFINGEEFAEYDDSATQKFIPGDPNNFIVFFRDHPSVLADEASPGFVSDIVIGNYAWTPDQIIEIWEDFCNSLLAVNNHKEIQSQIFPNPVKDLLHIKIDDPNPIGQVQILDVTGRDCLSASFQQNQFSVDISWLHQGIYMLRIIYENEVRVHKFKKE